MKTYRYIIVGGGMTGSAAVMGIRENDTDGSIAMFSREEYGPYNRPPLTKSLWNSKDIDDIIRPMDDYNVDSFLSTQVSHIDSGSKVIETKNGDQFKYEKLLLATGGHPRKLQDVPQDVIYYRTRADYHRLNELTESKEHFCVIGGGFIGSEISAALIKQDKKVTMIFPEVGISGMRFPDDLAEFLNDYYREKGVEVLNRNLVTNITKSDDLYRVQYKDLEDEETSDATFDAVIVGIGIKPNTYLADDADIEVEDGIVVNDFLETNQEGIFAAGDVAYFKHHGLGEYVRVEHEDNANKMGMTAGLNMSGEKKVYEHFPFFYSDLFDHGYEAVGDLNKDYEVYSDWIDPFKKGTIFYLKDDRVKGLIFWNLWDKVDQGREVIKAGDPYKKEDLKGLFTD